MTVEEFKEAVWEFLKPEGPETWHSEVVTLRSLDLWQGSQFRQRTTHPDDWRDGVMAMIVADYLRIKADLSLTMEALHEKAEKGDPH